jgi:hypothetical protein
MELVVQPITIVIFALFIAKAIVKRTWQKKFAAAALLLVGSLAVLARFSIALKENTTCTSPNVKATLVI